MNLLRSTCLVWAVAQMACIAASASKGGRAQGSTEFNGWGDAILLESREAAPKAVIVPSVGGRVFKYGLGADNVLWVDPASAGKKYEAGGAEFEPGGFYCDLGPESANFAPHADLTLGPWDFSIRKNYQVTLKVPENKAIGVEMQREVTFDPKSGELGFIHRFENHKDRDTAHTFWHRVACRPGGFVLVSVNKKSRFPAGWAVHRPETGRSSYDGNKPEVAGVRILDGVLVAKTGSGSSKIGLDSEAQWVAYALDRTLFIIHFPIYSSATYSDGGNSVTVAWDDRRTELQPLSAEVRVRGYKKADFPIKWSLIELPAPVSTHEEARALVERIPSSPFQ